MFAVFAVFAVLRRRMDAGWFEIPDNERLFT